MYFLDEEGFPNAPLGAAQHDQCCRWLLSSCITAAGGNCALPKGISTVLVSYFSSTVLKLFHIFFFYSSVRMFSFSIEKHFLPTCVMIKIMQSTFRLHPTDHLSIRQSLSLFVQLSPLMHTTHVPLHPGLTFLSTISCISSLSKLLECIYQRASVLCSAEYSM